MKRSRRIARGCVCPDLFQHADARDYGSNLDWMADGPDPFRADECEKCGKPTSGLRNCDDCTDKEQPR